jgi:hypothetical protein
MSGFKVDPSRLVATASGLEGLAARLQSEQGALHSAGANAELAGGNSLASGGIGSFTGSWDRVIHDLGRALTRDAGMLRQNASRYEQEDLQSAQHLQRLYPEPGP